MEFRQMRLTASLAPCHAFAYHFPMSGVLAQLPEVFDQESFNLERWSELAAFTPVMRTHEGNRPDENLQVDSTPQLLAQEKKEEGLSNEDLKLLYNFLVEDWAKVLLPRKRKKKVAN